MREKHISDIGQHSQEERISTRSIGREIPRGSSRVKTIEIRISGKVQRVGFRNCVRGIAGKLSVKGQVMNLADGTVRVFATADPILLEKFVSMIYSCPRAVIRYLEIQDCETMIFEDFSIRRIET